MEHFEFNATPEQAGEVLRQLGRIMADVPLERPPAGIAAPANKIRTYPHATFAYYPEGMRYLPDDTSIIYGFISTQHDDGSTEVFTVRQMVAHDIELTHQMLGPLNNDTDLPGFRVQGVRAARETDGQLNQASLRQEREWGLAATSFSDAHDLIARLNLLDPLDPRATS